MFVECLNGNSQSMKINLFKAKRMEIKNKYEKTDRFHWPETKDGDIRNIGRIKIGT